MKTLVASIVLVLLLLVVIFQIIIFNLFFYNLFIDYPLEQYINETKSVLNYLTNRGELNTILYQEIEILHLTDIKNLVLVIQIKTLGLALAMYFIFSKWRLNLKKVFATALAEIIIASLAVFFFFDFIFLKFHELVFPNDFWLLDPNIHLLIILFPPELFFKVAATTVVTALIILVILLSFLKFRKS